MDTDPSSRTASADDAAFIYHEWDARTRAHDIDGLLELYTPDAILETPLIPRILDQQRGVLTGREQSGRSSNAEPTTAPTSSCAGTEPAATTSTARP